MLSVAILSMCHAVLQWKWLNCSSSSTYLDTAFVTIDILWITLLGCQWRRWCVGRKCGQRKKFHRATWTLLLLRRTIKSKRKTYLANQVGSIFTQQRGTKPPLPAAGKRWSPRLAALPASWPWEKCCGNSSTRSWKYVHLNRCVTGSAAKCRSWKRYVKFHMVTPLRNSGDYELFIWHFLLEVIKWKGNWGLADIH